MKCNAHKVGPGWLVVLVLVAVLFGFGNVAEGVAAAKTDDGTAVVAAGKTTQELAANSVNINSADETALVELPGVGPAKAQAIIAYREANGAFKNIDDLLKVRGIGEKILAKVKPYLKAL